MKNKKRLLMIVGALIVLFTGAYFFVQKAFPQTPKKPEKVELKIKEEKIKMHAMPALIVNLMGTDSKRYLKIEVIIEYYSEKEEQVLALLEKRQILLSDTLIMMLSSKTINALVGFENKEVLKEEIRQKFEPIIFQKRLGKITNVYYKNFLIQ